VLQRVRPLIFLFLARPLITLLEEKFGKWRQPHILKFNFGIKPGLGDWADEHIGSPAAPLYG
jgi:hypothetical protein